MDNQSIGEQVIKIVRMILITENEVEELKVTLAENVRFDISDAFRAIDYNLKGYVMPQDIFRFMSKNGYNVKMKMCDFWIYTLGRGEQVTYKQFLEFIVPRYDRDAAMSCISRKLYTEMGQYKLTFYLEEFVSKLIYKELEFTEFLEIEKMKLAQMVEWKFNVVFKLLAGEQLAIDKNIFDRFLDRFGVKELSVRDYQMFLKRFNRNDDKLIQRDEFSDAIFPSGYLMQQKDEAKDGFYEYIQNQGQQLDKYLGRDMVSEQDDYVFKQEDHQINTSKVEDLVRDESRRQYLSEDPQLAVSHFQPIVPRPGVSMSFKPFPGEVTDPRNSVPIHTQPTGNLSRTKQYVSPNEQQPKPTKPNQEPNDLLSQFEKKPRDPYQTNPVWSNPQQQQQHQQQSAFFQNSALHNSSLQQSQLQDYLNQPSNAQLLLSIK